MNTLSVRTLLTGLALVATATGVAAQDRSALLTSIEVRMLVAHSQSSDHARLRDHFAALADRYALDAQRHRALSHVISGNPSHPQTPGAGAHHTRLADMAARSATTVRELSDHYGRLAAGQISHAPANSARFESGEGAPAPTNAQLHELSTGRRTAGDRTVLAQYFSEIAEGYARDARRHDAVAQGYRLHPNDRTGSFTALAFQRERLAQSSRESADAALVAAAEQRQPPTAD